ncbi:hypothetical protein H6G17_21415 [Chroococcidiopsis sp. FACHB-1243]|uniref:hypothetical protein n=1 Tax=Chroococcidiopsis sp. [FACHB-1243] TaxID=2692781 RepID=UPI00177D2276|nr:hypothetical protein [Chroococcidiopsis sp. [FACHB-1243]]
MNFMQHFRRIAIVLSAIFLLTTTVACSSSVQARQPNANVPTVSRSADYGQIARGNTPVGQDFGTWVTRTGKGLVQDAYVRDNNKLGVVITPDVRPNEVKPLAKSLAQGFHKNFPNQDLTVLMYAPDKKLILTARYDVQTNQIQYK